MADIAVLAPAEAEVVEMTEIDSGSCDSNRDGEHSSDGDCPMVAEVLTESSDQILLAGTVSGKKKRKIDDYVSAESPDGNKKARTDDNENVGDPRDDEDEMRYTVIHDDTTKAKSAESYGATGRESKPVVEEADVCCVSGESDRNGPVGSVSLEASSRPNDLVDHECAEAEVSKNPHAGMDADTSDGHENSAGDVGNATDVRAVASGSAEIAIVSEEVLDAPKYADIPATAEEAAREKVEPDGEEMKDASIVIHDDSSDAEVTKSDSDPEKIRAPLETIVEQPPPAKTFSESESLDAPAAECATEVIDVDAEVETEQRGEPVSTVVTEKTLEPLLPESLVVDAPTPTDAIVVHDSGDESSKEAEAATKCSEAVDAMSDNSGRGDVAVDVQVMAPEAVDVDVAEAKESAIASTSSEVIDDGKPQAKETGDVCMAVEHPEAGGETSSVNEDTKETEITAAQLGKTEVQVDTSVTMADLQPVQQSQSMLPEVPSAPSADDQSPSELRDDTPQDAILRAAHQAIPSTDPCPTSALEAASTVESHTSESHPETSPADPLDGDVRMADDHEPGSSEVLPGAPPAVQCSPDVTMGARQAEPDSAGSSSGDVPNTESLHVKMSCNSPSVVLPDLSSRAPADLPPPPAFVDVEPPQPQEHMTVNDPDVASVADQHSNAAQPQSTASDQHKTGAPDQDLTSESADPEPVADEQPTAPAPCIVELGSPVSIAPQNAQLASTNQAASLGSGDTATDGEPSRDLLDHPNPGPAGDGVCSKPSSPVCAVEAADRSGGQMDVEEVPENGPAVDAPKAASEEHGSKCDPDPAGAADCEMKMDHDGESASTAS